jgi:hypothetical protein
MVQIRQQLHRAVGMIAASVAGSVALVGPAQPAAASINCPSTIVPSRRPCAAGPSVEPGQTALTGHAFLELINDAGRQNG